jgi:hypothetical protein
MAVGGGIGGALFYLAMARAFNVPEVDEILSRVLRPLGLRTGAPEP